MLTAQMILKQDRPKVKQGYILSTISARVSFTLSVI